jgi:hypothetical protein
VKPFFTIEISIVNEQSVFLKEMIHDIGYRLKTNAICIEIKRIKDGFIDSTSSLAHIEWNDVNKILDNMRLINSKTYDNLATINKTILIGKSKQEEQEIMKNEGKNTKSSALDKKKDRLKQIC